VEDDAVIKSFARKKNEVIHGLWSFAGKEFDNHRTLLCFHAGSVFFLGINDHCWWGIPK
jgi:hypothetical protein